MGGYSPSKTSIMDGHYRFLNELMRIDPCRNTILAFLTHFQKELSSRLPSSASQSDPANGRLVVDTRSSQMLPIETPKKVADSFDFRHGSVGNFLLTGCRLFFKSLDAAIFQLVTLLGVPRDTSVIPVIANPSSKKVKQITGSPNEQIYQLYQKNQPLCSFDPSNPSFGLPELDSSLTIIAALLRNGNKIIGQCEISHPGEVVPDDADEARKLLAREVTSWLHRNL